MHLPLLGEPLAGFGGCHVDHSYERCRGEQRTPLGAQVLAHGLPVVTWWSVAGELCALGHLCA